MFKSNRLSKYFLLFHLGLGILTITNPLIAGTFVGNGGNAGDLELKVTLKQIEASLKAIIESETNEDLCVCSDLFSKSDVCEVLIELNPSQVNYCADFTKKIAQEIYNDKLLKNTIDWTWTHEDISVGKGPTKRAVEAVANPEKNEITVNLNRFLKMSPVDRVFLLSHELAHFAKWQGSYIDDEGPVGTFDGNQGKRKLINSFSASVVVWAEYEDQFFRYKRTLNRPRAWKKFWLELDLGSQTTESKPDAVFYNSQMDAVSVRGTYFWSDWGAFVGLKTLSQSHFVLSEIEAVEDNRILQMGLSYRIFPFKDPLNYWGQSFFVTSLAFEALSSNYRINDGFVSSEAEDETLGLSLEGKFYIPFFYQFWGFVGLNISFHNYKHPTLGVNYASPGYTPVIGVSYGF